MAYIVPKEMPKSCHDCQFHYCSEYHPFWSADKEKRNTQTIRCQAITPFRSTVLDIKDKTFKADWCPLVESADVVPKSEVERLEEELAKANADVKNYMKVAEYQQGLSVKRYHEIKRLNEDIERLQKALDAYEETSGLKQAKAEVAREIFAEIGKILYKHTNIAIKEKSITCELTIDYIGEDIAELKKKYIPKDCRDCKHMLSCEPSVLGICDEYEEKETKEEGGK
mgnify:CR=1 FL=1